MRTVNPNVAALLSFFFPGAGLIYAGRTLHGALYFLVWLMLVRLAIYMGGFFYLLLIVAWIYAMYDARREANKANERQRGA
ncbi:MAG: hypothetical protein K6T83_22110 [Alicyclobacillus sp.]|nr:hypothetical protein [Alicyclobacillus sp.]